MHVAFESRPTIQGKKIEGKALVPRISLNDNIYTPEIIEMNDGVCVEIDWNHDHRNGGNVCFTYDKNTEELFYRGEVTDPYIIEQISLNPDMHVSIEGEVYEATEVCNKKKCYPIPLEMRIIRMAITPTPGIPESTLTVIESKRPIYVFNSSIQSTATKQEVMTSKTIKEDDSNCPEGEEYNAASGKCQKIEAPKAEAKECGCKKETECPEGEIFDSEQGKCVKKQSEPKPDPSTTEVWKASMDQYHKEQKELKETIDNLKQIINKTTAKEVSELDAKMNFNKNLYSKTIISGGLKPSADDIGFIAKEMKDSLGKFGSYSFNLDLSPEWVNKSVAPRNYVSEAISFSGDQSNKVGVMNDVFVLPGGKYLKTIRDLVRFETIPDGADQIKLFKGSIPTQGTVTEGSETSASTHTATTITLSADTVTGVAQIIKKADIEDSPFQVMSYLAQTARAEVLAQEAILVFNTTAGAATPGRMINANTGATLASGDDVAGMTADAVGVASVLQYYEEQGYDTDFGNIGLVLHPKAMKELRTSSNLVQYVQNGDATITKSGRLTHLYGIELITGTPGIIEAQDNATNDTFRNVAFVKGHTFVLGSKREMDVNIWLNPRASAFEWQWTQRKNATTFDEASFVTLSSAQ